MYGLLLLIIVSIFYRYEGKYARTKTISRVEGTVARSRGTMPTVNHELQDSSMSNNEQAS